LGHVLRDEMQVAAYNSKEIKRIKENLQLSVQRIAKIRSMINDIKDQRDKERGQESDETPSLFEPTVTIKDADEEVLQELAAESAELLAV